MPARCSSSLALPMRPPSARAARAGRLPSAWLLGQQHADRCVARLSGMPFPCLWQAMLARCRALERWLPCAGSPWHFALGRQGTGSIATARRLSEPARALKSEVRFVAWPSGGGLRMIAWREVCHGLYAEVPVICRQKFLSSSTRVNDESVVTFKQQFQFA